MRLTAVLVIWAMLFYLVHGNAVFAYIIFHLLTTGLFCFKMSRSI